MTEGKRQLSIYVPQEKQKENPIARLAALAEARDRKLNFLVVEAILEYLDREIPLEDTPTKSVANREAPSKKVARPDRSSHSELMAPEVRSERSGEAKLREGEAADLVRAYAPEAAREINAAPLKTVLDPAVVEQLTDVLSLYFANGYRLNSPIEKARFRTFFAEGFGMELTLTD